MEDELASGSRGVDLLGEADKIHASIFEEVERFDEIFERAPQAVKLPHNHGITCPHKREKLL